MSWLLLALAAACSGGDQGEVPTAIVEMGDFVVELAAPGELKAVRSVTISVPDMGGQAKVTAIAEEGMRVKPGDLLVSFDTSELEQNLQEALSGLEVSRTKIAQKEAQLQVHLADLGNEVVRAQLSLEKAQMRVTDSETVPLVERQSAKLDVQEYTLALERSKAALEAARLEGEAELQLLRIEVAQAEARVDIVRGRISHGTLHAESEGLVILPEIWKGGSRGAVTVGDSVWEGSPIMELPDLSEMEVEAWVHEVDAGLVRAGLPVSVVIDAYPDPPHGGVVDRVADLAVRRDRDSQTKHVKLDIKLDETDLRMKPGMSVRAEVRVDEVDDVLSVPREAVRRDADGAYVQVRSLGRWSRSPVELGITNDTHVVVRSGLEVGDEVALVDPDMFEAGQAPGVSVGRDEAAAPGGT